MSYEQYQVVLAKVPNLNTVRLDYANLLADMDKNTEAIAQYNMYIKAFPNDINGYIRIADVYKEMNIFDKALENYLIAEEKDNTNLGLKKNIALCYHNRKDFNNAIKYYDEILSAESDNYEAKVNKALALHALHRYEDAITLYRESLAIKNDKTIKDNLNNALVARGHELLEIEKYDSAMTNFKTAIKEGYSDGFAYYGMAKVYRAQGNNTKASENYEKAISLDPDKTQSSAEYSDFISSLYKPKTTYDDTSTSEIAIVNITLDNLEENNVSNAKTTETASGPIVKTSSITMKQNEDLILEGDKNLKNNNLDAAVRNYQDALQLVPNDAVTLLKIGNIYNTKNENTKAINYYQKSIIVNPDYTDGWFNLGLGYINENNLIEAQKSFERVISLDSDYNVGYAYYALGRTFEHQGKTAEAIKNYKLFIKHNNDKEMINSVQEQIKQLQ